jgi:response regulator RpfG family c-di-GMP phosphodiesterase
MAIKSMANNVVKTKKIGDLIKRLKTNKVSYLFKHVQLTTFFGFHILQKIDWGTKEQVEKLAFTAFFHDIVLTNDKQASIHSNEDLRQAKFNPKEKELVNKHAQIAAGFINQMPSAPMGVDQIVRQHHGTLNGIDFSDHYSTNISPLATVFMLSEETAKILLSAPDTDTPLEFLINKLKDKFTTARFKKYIEILEQVQY